MGVWARFRPCVWRVVRSYSSPLPPPALPLIFTMLPPCLLSSFPCLVSLPLPPSMPSFHALALSPLARSLLLHWIESHYQVTSCSFVHFFMVGSLVIAVQCCVIPFRYNWNCQKARPRRLGQLPMSLHQGLNKILSHLLHLCCCWRRRWSICIWRWCQRLWWLELTLHHQSRR